MFFPGETIMHRFFIPFAKSEITEVVVSYKQGDHIVLEKRITSQDAFEDQVRSENAANHYCSFTVEFSESESLLFADNAQYEIQLNVLSGNSRHASRPVKSTSGIQFKREVVRHG